VSAPWPAVAAALLTPALIALLARTRWAARLADHPNERSLHRHPTPRLGGAAIVLVALPMALAQTAGTMDLVWALALGLALLSFADDLRSLPIAVRLAGHFTAAALVSAWMLFTQGAVHPWVAALTATLAIAWMTNLFNFMDGSDGLAGGMAAIGFGAYAAGAWTAQPQLAAASLTLAAAAAGFLAFNFPPARVFMGDAGSIPLGFLAGALGIHGALLGAWPAWFPLLVFSPFIADATATIARRSLRRERIWIAHRSHSYQRLVLSGWSARRLALHAYAVMLAAAASALAAREAVAPMQYAILAAWVGFYAVAIAVIARRRIQESASS
jgi:UDP-N-acetylmuramyl pentapeptide phosphotransferase/UDP-N-acetylglucosamine-1-phosphate transferase